MKFTLTITNENGEVVTKVENASVIIGSAITDDGENRFTSADAPGSLIAAACLSVREHTVFVAKEIAKKMLGEMSKMIDNTESEDEG